MLEREVHADGSLDCTLSEMFAFLIIIDESDLNPFLNYEVATYKYNNHCKKFILPKNNE